MRASKSSTGMATMTGVFRLAITKRLPDLQSLGRPARASLMFEASGMKNVHTVENRNEWVW
jgi:hypothetical protein